MSRLRKIPHLLWTALMAMLCAWGLSGIYMTALPAGGAGLVLPLSAGCICLLFGITDVLLSRRLRLIAFLGYAALECVLYALNTGLVRALQQAVTALYLHFSGVTGALLPFGREIALFFALLFSLLGYFLMREDAFGFTSVCVLSVLVLGLYLTGGEGFVYALPVMLSVLVSLSSFGGRKMGALILCPLIAVMSYFLLPQQHTTLAPLEKAADDIRNMVEDYFFFTDTRESFSMYKAGFQPLKSRLGGAVDPSHAPVMTVSAAPNTTLYLRASSYNEYTGLNWYDTLSGRRYLFSSQVYEDLRREIFDEARPLDYAADTQTVTVRLLKNDTTTLFTPQRVRSMDMLADRMVPYFNDAGEIYITRNLEQGDSYMIRYLPLDVSKKAVRDLIWQNATAPDMHMAQAEEAYLTVPHHIQQEVRDIASMVTANLSQPLDKALAIRDYLKTHYKYDLNVSEPPSSVDFIAYFLLGPDKAGYCTYFASAQTILCRMAGVPARYVVGYLAKTDADGSCTLTGDNAHAWTEIYLNGVGWVTLDATPGNQEDWEEDPEGNENDGNTPPDPTPSPSPTPTPTPTPTPDAPSPEAGETPTPTPEPDQQAPSPSPSPDVTPRPEEDPDEEDDKPFPWWILLLILCIAALCLWYVFSAPDQRATRNPDMAGDIFFAACVLLLKTMHLSRRSDETLLEFAARAQHACGVPLHHLYAAASAGVYGKNKKLDRRTAENALRMLLKKATRMQKIRMRLGMMAYRNR